MSNTIDFGIDLGTTNSSIARFIKGKVNVYKNPATWKDTCPSLVGFRKDRILVGEKAVAFREKDPKNVISQFKRKMGTTENFRIKSLDDSMTPIELSAHVLKELKTFVQTGEKVEAAVITIPASFDTIQSNATKQAAKEAGFNQIVLLQEPIAASLAYANQIKSEELTDGKWLVYDFGGGTFDVALVKIKDGEMKILDHEGDNFLGGCDFDRSIVENIIIPYLNTNFTEVNMESDLQSASGKFNSLFYQLLHKAELAKIELSSKSSTEIEFNFEDEEVSLVIADLGYRGVKFQTQMYEEEGILFITRADIESRSLKITHSLIRQRIEGIFSSLWARFATRVYSRSWSGLWNTLKLKMLDYKLCFADLISYA